MGGPRTVRNVSVAERRARLGRRHRLAAPAPDPLAAVESVVALHGTDPTTVYLSIWSRTSGAVATDVDRALYEDRTLFRLLAMRRTVFVVPQRAAGTVLAAASLDVAARERRKLVGWLARAGVAPDVEAWLGDVEQVVLAAVAEFGEAVAGEITRCDPRLATELVLGTGRMRQTVRVGSRVLLVLAAEGRVVRGRPLGSWTSTQFRWASPDRWFPGGIATVDVDAAQEDLARGWLRAFGPAHRDDLRWWTGWTVGRTRAVLDRIGAVTVSLDGVDGVILPDDLETEPQPDPWVALLPALDPTPMGWTRREFFLGDHGPAVFDRNGNVSPTVWADGRVVGGWAARPDGEIVVHLLEDIGADAAAAVERQAGELARWLGPVRLGLRARATSPLEADLLRDAR